jgi:hypothetical protein
MTTPSACRRPRIRLNDVGEENRRAHEHQAGLDEELRRGDGAHDTGCSTEMAHEQPQRQREDDVLEAQANRCGMAGHDEREPGERKHQREPLSESPDVTTLKRHARGRQHPEAEPCSQPRDEDCLAEQTRKAYVTAPLQRRQRRHEAQQDHEQRGTAKNDRNPVLVHPW